MRDALRAQNFARRRKSRQPPSVIRMIEVRRIRITSIASATAAPGRSGDLDFAQIRHRSLHCAKGGGMQRFFRIMFLGVLLSAESIVTAQECQARLQFKFANGQLGCITNYRFSEESVSGRFGTVGQGVPNGGLYVIAASRRSGRCPAAIGMASIRMNPSSLNGTVRSATQVTTERRARSEKAVENCQRDLDTPISAVPECSCKILIEEGVSPMNRDEFEAFVGSPAAAPSK
jgi:hypothetical protein